MLRRFLNQCSFDLRLTALEPLLIKSGTSVISGPDMAFVRTNKNNQLQPFIPGSSLKGVLRSHGERIARTLKPRLVCDVFKDARVVGCSDRLKNKVSKDASDYAKVCPACQLFGSLIWKGRFQIGDAYLTPEHIDVKPELRDGIAIDRVTGGVAGGAKFDMEVLPAGVEFTTHIDIQNFELWQLGWVSYIIRDLMEGHLRFGTGTARGLGRVKADLTSMEVSYIGEPEALSDHIPGIGALVSENEQKLYGLNLVDDQVQKGDAFTFVRPAGSLRSSLHLTDKTDQLAFMARVATAWDRFVKEKKPISA